MRRILMTISFLALVISGRAQDTQYSQFYSNPLYLNPAFAGTGSNTRVAFNHRTLWPNLPEAFASYSASIDYHAEPINSGFGLLVYTDKEGTASLSNTVTSLIYSYDINIEKHTVIRPAVQFGYLFRNIDQSKLIFSDQIEFGLDGVPSIDPNINAIGTQNYWDFGLGVLVYNSNHWFGMSAVHLNRPNITFLNNGQDRLAIRYTLHAGGRYQIGHSVFRERGSIPATIAPNMVYKKQGQFHQIEAGASVHTSPMILGLYYRGFPLKSATGNINHDAIIVHAGVEYRSFEFGYSFDMSISDFNVMDGGGAHEFSIQYGWRLPATPKHNVQHRHVKCPVHLSGGTY